MVNITAKTDVLFYRDNKLNPQSFTMENEFHYLGNNVLLEGADRSIYAPINDDPLLTTPIKKGFYWGKLALGVLAEVAAVAAVAAVVATGGAALVAAGAVSAATVSAATTGAAVAGGIAVAAKAATDIIRGEVSDAKFYAMDGAIAAVCGAFSGAVEGAFAAANAFKAKLGVQMLSSIGSDAIEQIIRGEFDPISMGINVGIEIVTLGCGEFFSKTNAGKNISKKVSDKTTEIVEGIANRINKANEFKNNISKNLKNAFTLENLEKFSKSLWTPKWYDDMFDKVVDSAENAIVNLRRNIDDFRRQMDIFINGGFALETASASPNYARRNIEKPNNNIMYSNSLGDNTQEAAEKAAKAARTARNKEANPHICGVVKDTGELDYFESAEEYLNKVEGYFFKENPNQRELVSLYRKDRTQEEAKESYKKVLETLKKTDPKDYDNKVKELYDIEKQRILKNNDDLLNEKYKFKVEQAKRGNREFVAKNTENLSDTARSYVDNVIFEKKLDFEAMNRIKLDIQSNKISPKYIEEISDYMDDIDATEEYYDILRNIDFGKYLEKIDDGIKPTDIDNMHAHHILFKKGNGKEQQKLVKEGQEILRKYKINPIVGKENLVWAPNGVVGQHDEAALKRVVDELKKVDTSNATRDKIVDVLKKMGDIAKER
ncbi:AHH domain-containing protein [Peptostreptococcaceae bacterium AGR-M142]